MKANYKISESDYVAAAHLFAKPTSKLVAIYIVSAIVLIGIAVFASPALRAGAVGGVVGGTVGWLIVRFIISPMLARRHYRKYKAMQAEFTVELLEDGVCFVSPTAEGKILWNQIHKWRQNNAFVLIYPMPRLYHIIPKTVASQGFELDKLTQALTQHVGKAL